MANRYPNLDPAEMDDLHSTLGEFLEQEYQKTLKAEKQAPKTATDRVAKAIFYLTKGMDMPQTMINSQTID
jgi:hypothetical protein